MGVRQVWDGLVEQSSRDLRRVTTCFVQMWELKLREGKQPRVTWLPGPMLHITALCGTRSVPFPGLASGSTLVPGFCTASPACILGGEVLWPPLAGRVWRPGFGTWQCHCASWRSLLCSLSLGLVICKMELIILPHRAGIGFK